MKNNRQTNRPETEDVLRTANARRYIGERDGRMSRSYNVLYFGNGDERSTMCGIVA